MREILFRAFHKPSQKWWTHEETLSVLMLQGRVADGIADDKGFLDRFVVEQYTGLKDKNGVKIFEGDIIQVSGDSKYRVGYNDFNEIAAFGVEYGTECYWSQFAVTPYHNKIIGNIHEGE